MMRPLIFAAVLFATALAFGGVGDADLTETATATCTTIDNGDTCLENHTCEPVRSLVEKATGQPTACVM